MARDMARKLLPVFLPVHPRSQQGADVHFKIKRTAKLGKVRMPGCTRNVPCRQSSPRARACQVGRPWQPAYLVIAGAAALYMTE